MEIAHTTRQDICGKGNRGEGFDSSKFSRRRAFLYVGNELGASGDFNKDGEPIDNKDSWYDLV